MKKINPFKPNSPVSTGMFAGRLNEIEQLERSLHQTKNGIPCNLLVTGERGIGKSSLMMVLKDFSIGNLETLDHGRFNFITINGIVSERTDLVTLIKLIERNIQRELAKTESIRNYLSATWEFVKRIRIMDSGIERSDDISDPDIILDEFAYSLAKTCNRVSNPEKGEEKKDGILLILDEADNASESLRIGYFYKAVTELLQQHGCNNVMFVVVGLPDITDKLLTSHGSSLRIFNQIKITELKPTDRERVVELGMEEANRLNTNKTTITADAKSHISTLSEGYPHFIQQFSYSAFEFNTDGEISVDDVLNAAFASGGAIDSIGTRYYAADYHSKIKSDEYRQVLSIMAESMNAWIKKSEIRDKFTGGDQTLTDALAALTKRKIILKNSSARGEYRLQQRGFALWIKLFGERKK
jgi:Cdc6-like AAA superfamily ATPase